MNEVNSAAKRDKYQKDGSRYGGGDLPSGKPGSNSNEFYYKRDLDEKEGKMPVPVGQVGKLQEPPAMAEDGGEDEKARFYHKDLAKGETLTAEEHGFLSGYHRKRSLSEEDLEADKKADTYSGLGD